MEAKALLHSLLFYLLIFSVLSTVSSYDYSDSESSSSSEEYEDNYGPDDIAEYHYDDFSEDLEYGGGGQHAAGGEAGKVHHQSGRGLMDYLGGLGDGIKFVLGLQPIRTHGNELTK
ncbi:hypothetical protein Fcan01_00909 [Folsomia candida]|uniref:Uncharacterized protein n=1 Tax=Folsomia candida TaxID=158441 RepID=A0A226F3M5_FOLCA|nr:hypothetical protein Fcan01_00909 [Folsomia candida]